LQLLMHRHFFFSFCSLMLAFLPAGAQRIISFNVFPANNSVLVKFVISAGPMCYGYTVLHSLDSMNYSQIYDFPGECGSYNSAMEYSYTHTTPALNQVNYYKIQLQPYEMSQVKRIYMSPAGYLNMIAYPNPVGDYSSNWLMLKIMNTKDLVVTGAVYDQSGNPVKTVNTRALGEIAAVDIGGLSNGLYVVWLTDYDQAYNAKFIIRR
jgi:hypothetical protein